MIPFIGQTFELKSSKKPLPPSVPYACIRKGALETYCYRTPSTNEFMFTDAKYAVRNYAGGAHLMVCTACVANAGMAIAKEEASMGVKIP